jgi:acyl carrier protein
MVQAVRLVPRAPFLEGAELKRSEVMDRLISIIRAQLEDESVRITAATAASDVAEWDSIAHARIIVDIEAQYGILFDPDEYTEFADVGELVDRVCEKIADKERNRNPGNPVVNDP